MSGDELMYIFQCCAASQKHERNCGECPLRDNYYCHAELSDLTIDYIMMQKAKHEHISYATEQMSKAISSLKNDA